MDNMKDNRFTDAEDYEIMRRGMQAILADFTVEHHMQQELREIVKKIQDMSIVIRERMKFMENLNERLDFDAPIMKDNIGKFIVNRQCKLIRARKELYLRYQQITGRQDRQDFTEEGILQPQKQDQEQDQEQREVEEDHSNYARAKITHHHHQSMSKKS